ncbi:MAG: hypothetical protein ACI9JL_001748, partial [Paracoccaceae bacterium]
MINFFGRKKLDPIESLTNQTLGSQSIMYRLFRERLGCDDAIIRRLELTYFAAAVMTVVYLGLGKKAGVLDEFTQNVLEKSIPSSGEKISVSAAVKIYQQRY